MIDLNYEAEVKSVQPLTPTVWKVVCQSTRVFSFRAGQYVMVKFFTENDAASETESPAFALALASSPDEAMLEFCIRLQEGSSISSYVRRLKVGSLLRIQGPFGRFVYDNPERRDVVMIGTGTGIAPLRAMLRSPEFLKNRPAHVAVLLGVRSEDEILYADEWKAYQKDWGESSFRFVPILSQATEEWSGFRGRVTAFLETWPEHEFPVGAEYYLCGHREMLQTVSHLLQQRGVPALLIQLSQ